MAKYNPKSRDELVKLVNDESVNLGDIDTSAITNMKDLFKDSNRMDFSGIESWDTSSVKTFVSAFENAKHFNSDISSWNVSSATNFAKMFWNATAFNQPIGAHWDTSNATSMIYMFCQAKNFNNGGKRFGEKWKMDKVKWTWRMFWGAENFNQPLNHWNVANVENMQRMFMNAKAFNQPLDSWNVANVKNMEEMFNGAESFNQDLSAWGDKLSKVINAKRAFANTKALNINFIQSWKFSNVCDKDNLTKGSALETSTKNIKKLNDFIVSQIKIKEKFYSEWESVIFKDAYTKWLPNNIKDEFRIYLARNDENDEIVKGDEKSWDFAFYEVFEHCFLVEKDKEYNSDKISKDTMIYNIFQKHKISDLQKDENFKQDKVKDIFENSEFNIKLDSQNMWIVNSSLTDDSEFIFGLLNTFILAQSYIIKMQKLEEKARENSTDSETLQKCYKEICNFDLRYYRSLPILNDTFLQDIWRKMSDFYMVAQTHKELKEIILQMAQVIGEEVKDREKKARDDEKNRFDKIMLIIGLLSLAGALASVIALIK